MEKLFYIDSHIADFTAVVTSCTQSKHGWEVTLDRSAFYPEGGGQPGDTGTLGGVRVTDTHGKDDDIVHYCESPLEVGSTVEGHIDYARRFEFMQLHSGEHIVSGLIHQRFGYENVGFHMGSDLVTIDFDGEITPEELAEIESAANELIWRDEEIIVAYPDAEELKTIPYRSKKELSGWVRIVTIPGADICACCGTHVGRTGEIGLVKLVSIQKFRSGVRIEMLAGRRAVAYVTAIMGQNTKISNLLSAKPNATAEAVARLAGEAESLKYRLFGCQDKVFASIAGANAGDGGCLLFEDDLTPDDLRRLADKLIGVNSGLCAVFSGRDGEGYRYAVAQAGGDLRAMIKEMNSALSGRGGGKPAFAQGQVSASKAEITAFFGK